MPDYRICSDFELTSLLKGGDQDAFAEIYDRYWAVLYRHALRMLRDEDLSGDIIQDVFLTLWNKAADLSISSSLSGFLYASVRNRVLDHWDHERVKEKYASSFHSFVATQECQTDFRIRETTLRELIDSEIYALPEHMRNAFLLSRNANMTHKEIALELGVSEHAVRNNISRALKILRVRLGDLALLCLIFNS